MRHRIDCNTTLAARCRPGRWAALAVAVLLASAWPSFAPAAIVVLSDLNSEVRIDTATDAGMYQWSMDGVNQLARQWFWYSVGGDPERPISNLLHDDVLDVKVTNGNFNPGDDRVKLRYHDPLGRFEIQIDYILTGGMPGTQTSDVAETIVVHNLSDAALDLQFYQYCDFDLGGTGIDTSVELLNPNTMRQVDLTANLQVDTIVTPAPNRTQVSYFPATINQLNDGVLTNLDNSTFLTNGDLEFAFQWSVLLAPGGTFLISKDKRISIVPEPSTWSLAALGVGIAALAARKRRPSRKARSGG